MLPIVADRRDIARVVKHKVDPTPSRLKYKLERLWLTRWFRGLVRVWIPLGVFLIAGYAAFNNPAVNGWVQTQYHNLRDDVAARPELRIEQVSIPVGSPDLQRQILGIIDITLPVSVFDTDLAAMRDLVLGLNAVKSVSVRFLDGGVLEVNIVERMPAMVWRDLNRIYLLDENGVMVAEVPRRSVRSDLPLIVGEGASAAMLEARELFSILSPVSSQVLGLVRMGERRWDVVLENSIVKLPTVGAADALRSLINLQAHDDILERDAPVIDMRDPNRTVLRLSEDALSELRRVRARMSGERV